jgi:hypothetical protein
MEEYVSRFRFQVSRLLNPFILYPLSVIFFLHSLPPETYIGILFEMATKKGQTTLRQAQGERDGAMLLTPFVLSPEPSRRIEA